MAIFCRVLFPTAEFAAFFPHLFAGPIVRAVMPNLGTPSFIYFQF